MLNKLIQKRAVHSAESSENKNMKISAMLDYFQDIAGDHSRALGVAREKLLEDFGVVWVLIRTKIVIEKMPVMGEELTLESFPLPPSAFFERDYFLKNSEGKVLVRSTSVWVHMNLGKREVVRRSGMKYPEGFEFCSEKAFDKSLRRLKVPADISNDSEYERTVFASDIDYNGHVNNAKYSDFLLDSFSQNFLQKNIVKSIEINFDGEVFENEKLKIVRKKVGDDEYFFEIKKVNDAEENVLKAKIHFSKE